MEFPVVLVVCQSYDLPGQRSIALFSGRGMEQTDEKSHIWLWVRMWYSRHRLVNIWIYHHMCSPSIQSILSTSIWFSPAFWIFPAKNLWIREWMSQGAWRFFMIVLWWWFRCRFRQGKTPGDLLDAVLARSRTEFHSCHSTDLNNWATGLW